MNSNREFSRAHASTTPATTTYHTRTQHKPANMSNINSKMATERDHINDEETTQLAGGGSETLAHVVRAADRACARNSTEYFRRGGSMKPWDERQRALMEATVLSRPGIARSTFAHGGAGSKRLLRERLQKKLWERKEQSGGEQQ
jgi:hypothetical protein